MIPAGTGHWFTKIDDHINYLMIRIDPDKLTPLKGEAQSKGVSVDAGAAVTIADPRAKASLAL